MYATVANQLGHGLYIIQDAKFIWINEGLAEMFKYQQEELLELSYFDIIHPDDWDFLQEVISRFCSDECEQMSFEVKGIKKDRNVINISVINKMILFEDKRTAIGSIINISECKKMELNMKESQQRYQTLVENAPLGILVLQNEIIEYANPLALSLLGAETLHDLKGLPIDSIIHQDFKSIVRDRIYIIKNLGKSVPTIYQKFLRLDGQEMDVEVKSMPIQLNGQSAIQVMFWDVTEKKKEEDLVRYRAYHDTLTDLPNRHKFELDFSEELNKDSTFTLMYIDLHGIKEINASHGHQAGNWVLVKVAARLAGLISDKGILYRIGGGQFAVVLPGKKQECEISDMAKSIAYIVSQRIYISNIIVQVCLNIGVVYYPDHGVDLDYLLRHAEMAIIHAKKTNTLYKKYDE